MTEPPSQPDRLEFCVASSRLSHDPSKEYREPRAFQALAPGALLEEYDAITTPGTDFLAWTAEALKEFLDKRGEDYEPDACHATLAHLAGEAERVAPAPPPTQKSDEVDPLEAFMAEIGALESSEPAAPEAKKARAPSERFEAEDHVADFVASRQRAQREEAAEEKEGGEDAAGPGSKRPLALPPAPPEAHASEPFERCLYEEPAALAALPEAEVDKYRASLEIRVQGPPAPRPVVSFEQCGFDAELLQAIARQGWSHPRPVQAQVLPAALSGLDCLALAATGSGKTAAYLLPAVVHLMQQREIARGEGPIAGVLVPTHELGAQVQREGARLGRCYGLRVANLTGGASKQQQAKDLRAGVEVFVGTPGRVIDLVRDKLLSLKRVTFLVLDEADRMLDLGFEPQVSSILDYIRPDRQTLLFSATMPACIARLASQALTDPLCVTVGSVQGGVSSSVRQHAHLLPDEAAKEHWLLENVSSFVDAGAVLVFVARKARAETLRETLARASRVRAGALHGDCAPAERQAALAALRSGNLHVLVATDVAARGLDVADLRTVVCFDPGEDAETHVHRAGRAGRDGGGGDAHVLLTPRDDRGAAVVARSMWAGGGTAPPEVVKLAARACAKGRGRAARGRGGGRGRGRGAGGGGIGFGDAALVPLTSQQAMEMAGGGGKGAGFQAPNFQTPNFQAPNFQTPSFQAPSSHLPLSNSHASNLPSSQHLVVRPQISLVKGFVASSAAPPPSLQPDAPPLPAPAPPSSQAASTAASALRSAFVSSGQRQGSATLAPEILPAKAQAAAGSRPLPPPPVPLAQQPLYSQPGEVARASAAAIAAAIAAKYSEPPLEAREPAGAQHSAVPPLPRADLFPPHSRSLPAAPQHFSADAQQYNPLPPAPQQYTPLPPAPQQYTPLPPVPQQYNPLPPVPQQHNPLPPLPQPYNALPHPLLAPPSAMPTAPEAPPGGPAAIQAAIAQARAIAARLAAQKRPE